MELYYEGVDITKDVQIVAAKSTDASGGRSDGLELTVEHADVWHRWQPRADDRIELSRDGYSTGTLYINAVAAEDNRYRILASSGKTAARQKRSMTFQGKTLEEIMKHCGGECGMEHRIFGLDKRLYYPYLQRYGMGSAAFLDKLAQMEGAVLKTYSGRFTMIGVLAAQELPAAQTIWLDTKQEGAFYERKDYAKIKSVTVCTPFARATATDTAIAQGEAVILGGMPARDPGTAGRWARGLLLSINRKAERLTIESGFQAGWSAMVRIDVDGEAATAGEWMIDEVKHDFVEGKSKATLVRCVRTVK